MGAVAEIIKIDADILNLRTKLKQKGSSELRARIEALLKQRQQLLQQLEAQLKAERRTPHRE